MCDRVLQANRSPVDGAIAQAAAFCIDTYLQTRPLGRTFRPAPRFLLCSNPLTIRTPDVAYVSAHTLAEFGIGELWRIAPDLIVEVLSHTSRQNEIEARVEHFFAAGTEIAWIVNACDRTCCVRRRNGKNRIYALEEQMYSAPVLPHLSLHVYDILE